MYASNTFQLLSRFIFSELLSKSTTSSNTQTSKNRSLVLCHYPISLPYRNSCSCPPPFPQRLSLIRTRVTDPMFPKGSCLHPPYIYDYIA